MHQLLPLLCLIAPDLKVQLLTSLVFLASGASPFPAACPFPFESSPGRLVAIIVNLVKFVTSKHESTQYTDTFFIKKRETRRKSENVQTRLSVIESKYILEFGNQTEPFLLSASSAAIYILATLMCRQTNRFSVYTAPIFQKKYSHT